MTQIKGGDKVCSGRYVWKCKDAEDQDWCNIYSADSEYVFLAWQLLDSLPDPIITSTSETTVIIPKENKTKPFVESSDSTLVAYIKSFPLLPDFELVDTYVLPLNITQCWDLFFSDGSLFSSQEATFEQIDNYNSWHAPTDPQYQTFYDYTVLQ
jgi:hypothetical protein